MLKIFVACLLASQMVFALAISSAPTYNSSEINKVAKSAIRSLTAMRGWNTSWDWAQGVGLYGIWKHYEATGDQASYKAVQDWYTTRLPQGQRKHVNSMSVMSTLADLYKTDHNAKWVSYLGEWGSWCMYNLTRTSEGGMQHITQLENKQQLWIDTLMMAAIPLAKIGLVLNKPEYVQEARKQFDIHIKYLKDAKTGLFFHGWTFIKNNNFAGAHWARGNAWAAITLTDTLELLYPNGELKGKLLSDTLQTHLLALQPFQDPQNEGLWRTVVDQPLEKGSYIETSASAGFIYSYTKAQRKGWLPADKYTSTIEFGNPRNLAEHRP